MALKIVRYGNIKPPPGAQIDWGHPLAQALAGVFLASPQALSDAVSGRAWILGSSSYFTAEGYFCGTGTNNGAYIPWSFQSPDVSVFWHGHFLGGSSTNPALVGVEHNISDQSPWCCLSLSWVNSNTLTIFGNNLGFFGSLSTSFYPTYNIPYTIAASTARYISINGVVVSESSRITPYYGATAVMDVGNYVPVPSRYTNTVTYCAYVWNRLLTRDELMWLSVEPYAMFYTSPQTSYSFSFRTPQSFDSNNPTQKVAQFTPFDSLFKNELSPQLSFRNTYDTLVFPDSNPRFAVFQGFYPDIKFPRGIRIELLWMTSSTTTTQSCVWGARIEPVSTDTDLDIASFNEISYGYGNPNSVSGKLTSTTIDIVDKPEIQFLQPKTPFRLVILREANSMYDTLTANAELVAVKVYRI